MGNKDEKNAIREWIEAIKYKKRMTQQDIAKELGVSKTYLSDVITGRSPYSDKLKQRLSELYSDCIVDSPIMYGGNVEQANVMGDNIKNSTDSVFQRLAGIGNLERVVFSGKVLEQGTLSAQINADNAFLIRYPTFHIIIDNIRTHAR